MSHATDYPRGKRLVKYKKRPKNGLQAEVNAKLPHVEIPEDGAIVEVSAELAWKLIETGRADAAEAPEPNAQAVVPKAESPAPEPEPEPDPKSGDEIDGEEWEDYEDESEPV